MDEYVPTPMDEKPADDLTAFYASIALIHALDNNEAFVKMWLKRIPRSERGRVNMALEDAKLILSRLGNS